MLYEVIVSYSIFIGVIILYLYEVGNVFIVKENGDGIFSEKFWSFGVIVDYFDINVDWFNKMVKWCKKVSIIVYCFWNGVSFRWYGV